jgi:hypothetical protein
VANDDGSVIFYYCCDNLLGLPTSLALSSLHRLRSYFSRVIPPAVWPETWSESDDRLYTVLIRANPTAASLEIWKRYVALPSVTMWGCQEQPDHRELLGLDLPPVHVGQESSRAHSIQKKTTLGFQEVTSVIQSENLTSVIPIQGPHRAPTGI